MKQYYDLVEEIRTDGVQTPNRTGIDAVSIPGAMMKFRMKDGFPMLGGRFTPFKSMVGELCGFWRGYTSAADFRKLGCKVWDKNANDPGIDNSNAWLRNAFRKGEDDIGPVYGEQWRNWPGLKFFYGGLGAMTNVENQMKADGWEYMGEVGEHDGRSANDFVKEGELWSKKIDQLGDAIRTIIKNPESRRILFHGWNPAVLDEVALPACHLLYQLVPVPSKKILNMVVYIRSNDIGLGAPYNISQASAQLHVISRVTGYTPGTVSYMVGDAHIYVNQTEWMDEQLHLWSSGQRFDLPTLEIDENVWQFPVNPLPDHLDHYCDMAIKTLETIEPEDFRLINYKYHTLKTPTPPMAV